MTQLAFDFDIAPAPLPALYYSSMVAADKCRDCHRSIAGRNTRCYQGGGVSGMWVVCDQCNPLGPVPK